MLILYVFDDKLSGTECLLTHLTYVLLIGNDLTCLIHAVLVLRLYKKLILLWVAKLLIRALLENFSCCLDIILFELASSAVKS